MTCFKRNVGKTSREQDFVDIPIIFFTSDGARSCQEHNVFTLSLCNSLDSSDNCGVIFCFTNASVMLLILAWRKVAKLLAVSFSFSDTGKILFF